MRKTPNESAPEVIFHPKKIGIPPMIKAVFSSLFLTPLRKFIFLQNIKPI